MPIFELMKEHRVLKRGSVICFLIFLDKTILWISPSGLMLFTECVDNKVKTSPGISKSHCILSPDLLLSCDKRGCPLGGLV